MDKDNPAVYECEGSKNKLHTWKRNEDGTAYCMKCDRLISKPHADEVWTNNDK